MKERFYTYVIETTEKCMCCIDYSIMIETNTY